MKKDRKRLIAAAMGKIPCDLTVKNVQFVNVFTGEIYPAEVDVIDGWVARVRYPEEPQELESKETVDGEGHYLIPGFLDAHVHIESSMMIPEQFGRAVVPWGTTTVCTDPHEIANVLGIDGVKFMLENGRKSLLRQFVLAPSCVPAVPGLEYSGAEFGAEEIGEILDMDGVVGIASRSAWYGTLAAYYILLSILRFTAVREAGILSGKADGEERLPAEIRFYRWCGILFIIMTVALCGTVILILDEEGGKHYPGSLIYGAALYVFYKMIMSVVNLVKVRKHRSPLLLAIRDIGYVDACVSILSLQTAMFASFGTGEKEFSRLMNGVTGAAVCLMVLGTGIRAVWMAGKMKQKWKEI